MIYCFVQARMNSQRFPYKITQSINGKSLLSICIERLKKSRLIDRIAVLTTEHRIDNTTAEIAAASGVLCYRGTEKDVLKRFDDAANHFNLKGNDIILRITADCPLIDPLVVDHVIEVHERGGYDYAKTGDTYPDGFDVEAFRVSALHKAHERAIKPYQREHVCPWMYEHPDELKCLTIEYKRNLRHYRLSVDYFTDFVVVGFLLTQLPFHASMLMIITYLDFHPAVLALNQGIERNEGLRLSKVEVKEVQNHEG